MYIYLLCIFYRIYLQQIQYSFASEVSVLITRDKSFLAHCYISRDEMYLKYFHLGFNQVPTAVVFDEIIDTKDVKLRMLRVQLLTTQDVAFHIGVLPSLKLLCFIQSVRSRTCVRIKRCSNIYSLCQSFDIHDYTYLH